jgi:hypothetical protein
VSDHSDIVAARPAQRTTISHLLLHIRHNRTFWHNTQWQDVSDSESRILAGVDELASVHALIGDESLGVQLEAVGIAELDFGQRCAAAWIVDDVFDDAANVSVALGVVVGAELGWVLVQTCSEVNF